MASWVTHLMIADKVMERIPELDRRGFCVGSIAPDCNVENEDWTQFVPSRETTHWMASDHKTPADCERFYHAYIAEKTFRSEEERSFLLGYYAHLIADAEYHRFIRNDGRVMAAWARILDSPGLAHRARGMEASWDAIKLLIGKRDRMRDIHTIEAEYLEKHPDCGYLTEVLTLKSFPDYIPYLPKGAIVRKIGIMGYRPRKQKGAYPFAAVSRAEYAGYINGAVEKVVRGICGREAVPQNEGNVIA